MLVFCITFWHLQPLLAQSTYILEACTEKKDIFLIPFPVHCGCGRCFCSSTRGSLFQENLFPGGSFMLDNYAHSYFKIKIITEYYLLVNLQWHLHYLKPYKDIWKKIFTGTDGGLVLDTIKMPNCHLYFLEILSTLIANLLKKKEK